MWKFGRPFWTSLALSVPPFVCALASYQAHSVGRVTLFVVATLMWVAVAFMSAWRGRRAPLG